MKLSCEFVAVFVTLFALLQSTAVAGDLPHPSRISFTSFATILATATSIASILTTARLTRPISIAWPSRV